MAHVGGWWPRTNTPEIAKLARDAVSVPGVTVGTPIVAVSPAGVVDGTPVAGAWTAADLLAAWP
ncbi:hypothetical protein [Cellulomonas fimi]|uniref:Uncharacterized protein n=1 Tax=Cellulomonas fimi TaxID=1708 RepID=A0A7Y0QHD2_CELFI|nr:hypothetical protein [Cellulomonas fimi]NMR20058.1 hypothetical protein [Cellulomonas fimi]